MIKLKLTGILLLIMLAALTVHQLVRQLRGASTAARPALSVRLDYQFNDVIYQELNERGQPFIHLTTPHLSHDPESDWATADAPRLLIHQPDRDWQISARQGQLQRNSDILHLDGEVLISSLGTEPSMRLETEQLRYYAQSREVAADGPVRLQRERAVATGTGLTGNIDRGHYRLLHDVEITINALGND